MWLYWNIKGRTIKCLFNGASQYMWKKTPNAIQEIKDGFRVCMHRRMQTEEKFGRTQEQISANPRPKVEGLHLLEIPVLITYTLFISPFFAAIECLKGFSIIYTYSELIINKISSIYLKISRTFWTFADLGLLGTFWEIVRDFLSDSPLVFHRVCLARHSLCRTADVNTANIYHKLVF